MDFKTLYQELVNSTEMIVALLADISQDEAQPVVTGTERGLFQRDVFVVVFEGQ